MHFHTSVECFIDTKGILFTNCIAAAFANDDA
jgi:hypothetical protein